MKTPDFGPEAVASTRPSPSCPCAADVPRHGVISYAGAQKNIGPADRRWLSSK
ncbi:hypothetical protein KCP76_19205 [Salmonella enterica subsp. enterica serovar Weltevreden]|nr:hypothetical protein KCP76_19205 [Salmonella enterica subsp. enterica serovar Weltevreden]